MSDALASTRSALHRVAVHVLARRRHQVTGRFGLRALPGGFGTPAFGPPESIEVLRVAGPWLVREIGGDTQVTALDGATLAKLAAFAGTDLGAEFSAGHDTIPVGDHEAPLRVTPADVGTLADWFDLGWRALDAAAATAMRPTVVQLWPEHFDAGCSVAFGPGEGDRANLGASAGDAFCPEPYLYVGPWGPERPGDPTFWNAPFGAFRPASAIGGLGDAVAFLGQGLAALAP